MIDPTGRFALVAGNAEDLGHAVARELAAAGMTVAMLCDQADAVRALADELPSVHAFVTDFTDAHVLRDSAQQVLERFGTPRLLVHNSAVFRETPVLELDVPGFTAETDSILQSAFVLSKAVWPGMVSARDGSIVFVSSGSALSGFANEAAYVAGKHGQEGLMKVLALEGGEHDVAVNTITTGAPIDGPLAYTYSDAQRAVMVPPSRLAPAFAFLAGIDADFASGHRFNAFQLSEAIRVTREGAST
ncbi:NAD(P)-dependent dehydrogenase (short-subunit alcohol dehydrogenase family) [Saccharothrix tamanrassetensis]|uniref:NAD(P)-dependent dehydrogenase (Short-subunit alcohol dehydrogenase family) n=1 Tax=Saccharothrix tamanrassetensis TaxID=1051531 RepID=A0A841CF88_9PSEU|nr:SDR family oxidoreductase [Saccharothrix tamanrassetensis]MBB5957212.1 NAD(P)-dependent dehydrogenase (short-subunit alcohol dehydrogenase family) [Saccharothrix tamanrassetensis]